MPITAYMPCALRSFGRFSIRYMRLLRRAPKHGKDGRLGQMRNPVIAPLAGGDHAPVKPEDHPKFLAVEGDGLGLWR
jgi:hypothetical protein